MEKKVEIKSRVVVREELDIAKLEYIILNWDVLKEEVGCIRDPKNAYQKASIEATKTYLDKILKRKQKKIFEIEYTYSKSSPDGRLFSKEGSLQGMSKVLRSVLSKDYYWDIDIYNAHPTFLVHYCKNNGIPCKNLEEYNLNREKYLKELIELYNITRDDAKSEMLAKVNGGSMKILNNKKYEHIKPPKWLYDYQLELDFISQKVLELNPKFKKEAEKKKGKDYWNIKGSTLNKVLCHIENEILQHMISYCDENNIRIGALCFDGFLMYQKPDFDLKDFLKKIEEYIFESLQIKIQLTEKQMTEGEKLQSEIEKLIIFENKIKSEEEEEEFNLQEEKKKIEEEKLKKFLIKDVLETDEKCAHYIISKIEKDVFYDEQIKKIYFYNEESKLFELNELTKIMTLMSEICIPIYSEKIDEINEALEKDEENKFFLKMVEKYKNKIIDIQQTYHQRNILTQIVNNLEKKNEYIEHNFNRKEYLFPFGDKIYDFRSNKIRERTREDLFTYTTDNEYVYEPNKKEIDKYIASLLKMDYKKDIKSIENIYSLIGYFMTGNNELKIFPMITGPTNSGKSEFLKFIKVFLGKYSVGLDSRVFIERKSESVANSELFPMVGGIRLGHISEVKSDSKFNIDILKQITGNDKHISMRRCKGDQETHIVDCKLLMIMNSENIPSFSDSALSGRIINIPFINKFEKDSKKIEKLWELKNDFFTICLTFGYQFYKNKKIDWESFILESTDDLKDDSDDISRFINEKIEITKDPKDSYPKIELYKKYQDYCLENKIKDLAGRNGFYGRMKDVYNLKIKRSDFIGVKDKNIRLLKLSEEI